MSIKQKVSSAELKDLIQLRLGFPAILVIHRNAQLGFTAAVIADPSRVIATQQAVDAIVEDLRESYEMVDLKAQSPAMR